VKKIRAHAQYEDLSGNELDIIYDIMEKALESNRKEYYFQKLTLLLDTTTNPTSIIQTLNNARIDRSVEESKKKRREIAKKSKQDLEEYMNSEELYELRKDLVWLGYRPESDGTLFYVSYEDNTDILVNIRVRLRGNYKLIEKILSFEDAIEKHLYVEGFSVNLVFVGYKDEDVFDVNVNPNRWTTSNNWSGGYKALAHELMHLMGLLDEYDRIEYHANNKNASRIQRLFQFRTQMSDEVPSDSKNGIMCSNWLKPLERHVCAAVGLSEKCVEQRMKAFHPDEE
jgi:hypothetical protein